MNLLALQQRLPRTARLLGRRSMFPIPSLATGCAWREGRGDNYKLASNVGCRFSDCFCGIAEFHLHVRRRAPSEYSFARWVNVYDVQGQPGGLRCRHRGWLCRCRERGNSRPRGRIRLKRSHPLRHFTVRAERSGINLVSICKGRSRGKLIAHFELQRGPWRS
jgi:hypothetical protein